MSRVPVSVFYDQEATARAYEADALSGQTSKEQITFITRNYARNSEDRFDTFWEPTGSGLKWAPPEGCEKYQQVDIPTNKRLVILDLDPAIDYLLTAAGTVEGQVDIRGGRNIVWIGGHIQMEGFSPNATGQQRRALVISDAGGERTGRVVHIEGVLCDGDDLAEGVNTDCPSAIVQLVNNRVELVKIKSADDRDNRGNHADLLQPWGSQLEMRVDMFTGRSNYQGFYLREAFNAVLGSYHLSRINVEGIETTTAINNGGDGLPYANVRFFRSDDLAEVGPWILDGDTVWVKGHPNGFGAGELAEIVYPPPTLVARDGLGEYVEWPGVTLTDGRPFAVGRIRDGVPPTGDYVPAGVAGIGYVSPGYQSVGMTWRDIGSLVLE